MLLVGQIGPYIQAARHAWPGGDCSGEILALGSVWTVFRASLQITSQLSALDPGKGAQMLAFG